MKIAINELFHSIQGEGPNCGVPAIFIRFQGCQLRCPWCDTGASLDPDDPHDEMTPEEIISRIGAWPCRHVVITGGDPTFQMAGLDALTTMLCDAGYTLELETSGVKPVPEEICGRFERINVGLKLPNDEQHFADQYYRHAAEHYGPMPNAGFKIVITGEADVEFVRKRLIENKLLPRERTCLMPLGETREELARNTPLVLEACRELNLRLSPRLHIMLGVR